MTRREPKRDARQLVILTGLSGSGKGSVLKTFEDLGFYCVDNLPVALISTFSELYEGGRGEIERAALLVDAREGEQIEKLPGIYRKLSSERPATLVFIEASDEALLRRFSETRRPHPLSQGRSVAEGIREERRRMAPIRRLADVVIDTTKFNVHELHQFIIDRFQRAGRRPLLVSVVSFGYRYGIPADADLVFDVRFLPNPHFVPRLRPFSGKDPRVARYIRSFPQTAEFLRRIESLLGYLIPHYIREGKSYLTVAFGCTGGRHRSVMLAEVIRRALQRKGYAAKVVHRDLDKSAS
ncbi:MAG TPA: RNase adapter RapZ [Candidatus Polarisedimenticolia bacterium]|nr:RNase adapter RapZ [Candidatus Polarisedimenticolia bacterium]